MLTLTESASAHLNDLLAKSDAPDDAAARFVPGEQGLRLVLDQPRDGDQTFDHEDKTVLVMEPQVAQFLEQATLDTEKTEQGEQLTLRGPEPEAAE